jgi:hypothetical protein
VRAAIGDDRHSRAADVARSDAENPGREIQARSFLLTIVSLSMERRGRNTARTRRCLGDVGRDSQVSRRQAAGFHARSPARPRVCYRRFTAS